MGALVSWMLKSRLLTTQLSTAFKRIREGEKDRWEGSRRLRGRRKRLGTSKVAWDP